MEIRRVRDEERFDTTSPLGIYAFGSTPMSTGDLDRLRGFSAYSYGNVTLVADEAGEAVAAASAVPMRQNVRGLVLPMAGIVGVATHPLARRQGHVRKLLIRLLGDMRDDGHHVSALYPFRSSFYERFGYLGLHRATTITFSPADLGPLLRADLPGTLHWGLGAAGYQDYLEITERLLNVRHGFAKFPEYRTARLRDAGEDWLVIARAGSEVVGAVQYRILEHGGELQAQDLLYTDPVGRALLLQFFARHVDQVDRVSVKVGPDEAPNQWATDLAYTSETKVSFPRHGAPAARVLNLAALSGLAVGPGRVTVEVVDDPFIAGRYALGGDGGKLEVSGSAPGEPAATLTVAGLSGLVYGVLDPVEVALRGLGTVPPEAAAQLRTLFPPRRPHVVADF
jgi:hypothetical protein